MPSGPPRVWKSEHFEAGTKYPSARVVDRDGAVCIQGDFGTNAVIRVYDMSGESPSEAVFSNTVAVSSVVFNSLQEWDLEGDAGYNFRTEISSNDVAWEGGHVYRVSCLLPHLEEGSLPVVFDIAIRPLMSL